MKDNHKYKKRFLALLLSIAMIITYMPMSVIAYTGESGDAVVEEVAADKAEPAAEEAAPAKKAEDPAPVEKAEEPAAEKAPAEDAAPVEEKASEEKAESADGDAKAEEKAEEPADTAEEDEAAVFGGEYSAKLDEVSVKVTTKKDAFKEKVELVVKLLDEKNDKAAFDEAEKELADNDQVYDGLLLFDIHFENSEGSEIEPEGTVSVEMTANREGLKDIDAAAFNADTVQITHIGDETEVVADTDDNSKVEGTVEVDSNSKAVKEIKADFEVDSFSTFALTWTGGGATIHWGYMDGTEHFKELEEDSTVVLDTTAGTVSLLNNYEDYYYSGAVYCAPGQTFSEGVNIETNLKKVEGGWQCNAITGEEHDVITPTIIEDGSNIYVTFLDEGEPNPSGASDNKIPSPVTTKNVTVNADGSATVQLDIKGASVSEDHSHYANVLIILDATRSMNGAKWTNAKAAMNTLIETLTEGENASNAGKIDFALVTFGRSATVVQNWTKNNTAFKSTCAGINMVTTSGTNWEAGMRGGLYGVLNNLPDNDQTYVIFLTDGDPNVYYSSGAATNYTNDGTTNGYSQNANTSANHSADEAKEIASKTKLYGIYCGDSGTTPSGESFNRLASVITGSGQGGQKTISANADTIGNEFKLIAQTMIDEMGANNVSVDDGVTTLSSISADVAGQPGGYEYFKSTDGTNFTKWAEAPGATYSSDNGVTWDLSSAGTLKAGTTYRVKFTVWPSQEALDIIANLNNGTQFYTYAEYKAANPDSTLTEAQAIEQGLVITKEQHDQIAKGSSGYTLKTNTHLNTTYTFKDETYTDIADPLVNGDMPLMSEEMTVEKAFAHDINAQDPYTSIVFYLTVDGEYYQTDGSTSPTLVTEGNVKAVELPVNVGNDWKNKIYIAPGFIKGGQILEPGHAYSLEEKVLVGNEYEYGFTPQTVRPMIIDGTLTYLVLKDKYNTNPDGATEYTIDGDTYYVAPEGNDGKLIGTNRKTAELDITKMIKDNTGNFTQDQLNEETFTYRVNLTVPAGSDISGITAYEYVARWDDAPASNRYTIFGYQNSEDDGVKGIDSDVERFSGKIYGGYTVTTSPNNRQMTDMFTENEDGTLSATIDITLKQKEIIRFTNLPAGTTYTITEMYNNYRQADPSRDADAAGSTMASNIADMGYTTTVATKSRNPVTEEIRTGSASGTTVSGTIDYLDARYYNQFTNTLNKAIDVELVGTKHLDGYEWSGERYYFNLAATNDGPLPVVGANGRVRFYVSNADGSADKSYSFGKIRFTEAGTYTYTITEDNAGTLQAVNGTPVKFGDVETITIKIVENNGKLSVESVTNTSGHTVWDAQTKTADTTITNTNEKVSLNGKKTWDDSENQDGMRPDAIIISVMQKIADGAWEAVKVTVDGQEKNLTATVAANGDGTYSFADLPRYAVQGGETIAEIAYKIVETGAVYGTEEKDGVPAGYSATYTSGEAGAGYEKQEENGKVKYISDVTNKHETEKISVKATKVWDDNNNQDGKRKAVTFHLNKAVGDGEAAVVEGQDKTIAADATGAALTVTWPDLDAYEGGQKINYSVTEDEVAEYTTTITGDAENGFIITNKHVPQKTTVQVTKVWEDNDDQDGIRPESVEITLLADGKAASQSGITAKQTLNEGNEWTYTWTGLDVYANGKEIKYTVDEAAVPTGYEKTVSEVTGSAKEGFKVEVENKHQPATTTVKVTKVWEDNENQDGIQPESVEVTLLADGKAVSQTGITAKQTLNEGNKWTYTWEGLNEKRDGGTNIVYTVEETKKGVITGTDKEGEYAFKVTGTAAGGYTVTNTHTPVTITIDGVKTWNDAKYFDKDGKPIGDYKRPNITIVLNGSDESEYKVTLDGTADTAPTGTAPAGYESAAWAYTFVNLPKYNAGTKIDYTLSEIDEDGFVSEIDEYNVENTPVEDEEVHETSLTLHKVDAVTGNIITASEATFELTKDGNTQTLTTENGVLTITFAKGGNEAGTYTLKEKTAPTGYTVTDKTYTIKVDKTFRNVELKNKVWTWIYDLLFDNATKAQFDEDTQTLTVPNPPIPTKVTANKKWNDNNDKDKKRPTQISLTLKAEAGEWTKTYDAVTVEAAPDGTWSYTWDPVESYRDGTEIEYTVEEAAVADYTTTYSDVTGSVADGYEVTITNSHQSEPLKTVHRGEEQTMIDGELVEPGQILTYKIEYTNTTGEVAEDATITDEIPEFTTYVKDSATLDGAKAGTYDEGSRTITWELGDVEDGGKRTVTFQVEVDKHGASGEELKNQGIVHVGENDYTSNETSNPTPPDKDVVDGTNTSIDGKTVKPGDTLTYVIKYTNPKDVPVDATITDEIPKYTKYVPDSADNNGKYDESSNKITWNLSVPASKPATDEEEATKGSVEVRFQVTVLSVTEDGEEVNGQAIKNKASVNGVDTNEVTNNTPPKKIVYLPSDEKKTNIDGEDVQPGQILTYSITYTNPDKENEAEVEFRDEIPSHTTYVDGSAKPELSDESTDVMLVWKKITVAAGKSATVTFNVKVDETVDGDEIENEGTVKNGENDPMVTNKVINKTPTKVTIVKDLSNFVDHGKNEKATFAFSITGDSTSDKHDDYSNVIGMDFEKAETRYATVLIPSYIDLETVNVKEVISGDYTPDHPEASITKGEDGKWKVTFKNKYTDTGYKTGTINNYKYNNENGTYTTPEGPGDGQSQEGDGPGDGSGN